MKNRATAQRIEAARRNGKDVIRRAKAQQSEAMDEPCMEGQRNCVERHGNDWHSYGKDWRCSARLCGGEENRGKDFKNTKRRES